MFSLFGYSFAQNAVMAMVALSLLSAVVGSYIVVRRMVFAAGGITHAGFGGIGLACYAGFNPTIGALLFSVMAALGINVAVAKGGIRHDSAIAMLWSLGMAIGVIFISLVPGYAPNLMGYMFGDILAVSTADVMASGAAALGCLFFAILFYRPIMYTAFDASYAGIAGWHPHRVSLVASVVMALAISLSIKAVGIILVLSVFSIPQTIALAFCHRLSTLMIGSGIVALLFSFVGLALSFLFDLPSGAVITALLSIALLLQKVFIRCGNRRRC